MAIPNAPAPEVETIGKELIGAHHHYLQGVEVMFAWRSKAKRNGTKLVGGTARVVRGLQAFLAGREDDFYLIQVAQDVWATLTEEQRKALADHELCHCAEPDFETGALGIIPHDVQEFRSIVERHGLWTQDLTSFARAFEQLALPGTDA